MIISLTRNPRQHNLSVEEISGNGTFQAGAGKISSLGFLQVRIYVMTTLTQESLQIDEGWYNAQDGSKVIELDGPIFMTKEKTFSDSSYRSNTHSENKETSKAQLQSDGRKSSKNTRHMPNAIPQNTLTRHAPAASFNNMPVSSDKRLQDNDAGLYNAINSYVHSFPQGRGMASVNHVDAASKRTANDIIETTTNEKSMWTLQTYEGVIDALQSGHKVYFTAKTKKCQHVGAKKREKTFFGDYVDMFEIQKDFTDKQPNKYLQFTHRRTQYTRKGFQDVIKQVTTHRNGTVHIITVYLNENGKIVKNYFSDCKLYDQDTRKGDIRFYLNPYRDVSAITRSKALHSALQNGNMVRFTVELDKCSGGHSDHVIIGGEMRGYDMGRNGKTVDVNLKNTEIVQKFNGDISVQQHYLILQFPVRGEITLIRHRKHVTSLLQNVSIVNGYQRYMCEMDANSSTKSISIFNT